MGPVMKIIRFIKEYIFKVCPYCNHSLINNDHGPDQNDMYLDENDKLHHYSNCTYCLICRNESLGIK
jgi:hypothetical protein